GLDSKRLQPVPPCDGRARRKRVLSLRGEADGGVRQDKAVDLDCRARRERGHDYGADGASDADYGPQAKLLYQQVEILRVLVYVDRLRRSGRTAGGAQIAGDAE